MIDHFYLTYRLEPKSNPGHSETRNNGNKGLFHISQSSRTGASLLDGLVSYLGHSLWRGLTSLQRCGWRILQPWPTGMYVFKT